jgi:hypothetical protein
VGDPFIDVPPGYLGLTENFNERPSSCRFSFLVWVFYRAWGEKYHHGVDAMNETESAVTPDVTLNYDGSDVRDLDRLAASLECLGLDGGEFDAVGDSCNR